MKKNNIFKLFEHKPNIDKLALLEVLEAIIAHNMKGNILEWKALAKELDNILEKHELNKNK